MQDDPVIGAAGCRDAEQKQQNSQPDGRESRTERAEKGHGT
jgi:hypothetical protein